MALVAIKSGRHTLKHRELISRIGMITIAGLLALQRRDEKVLFTHMMDQLN